MITHKLLKDNYFNDNLTIL